MKKLIVGICLLGAMASCIGGKKQADGQDLQTELMDTTEVVADTLLVEEVEEPIVPLTADESFADFLYNFALD